MNYKRREAIELACSAIKKRSSPLLDRVEFIFEERHDDVAVSFEENKLTVNCQLIGERCARQRIGHNQMDSFIFWLLERNAVLILKNQPFNMNLLGESVQAEIRKNK